MPFLRPAVIESGHPRLERGHLGLVSEEPTDVADGLVRRLEPLVDMVEERGGLHGPRRVALELLLQVGEVDSVALDEHCLEALARFALEPVGALGHAFDLGDVVERLAVGLVGIPFEELPVSRDQASIHPVLIPRSDATRCLYRGRVADGHEEQTDSQCQNDGCGDHDVPPREICRQPASSIRRRAGADLDLLRAFLSRDGVQMP